MSERKLASIQKVIEIVPIPNADDHKLIDLMKPLNQKKWV
jgi:hypothetical protein